MRGPRDGHGNRRERICVLLVTFFYLLSETHFLCFPSFQTHLPLLPVPVAASLSHQSESSPLYSSVAITDYAAESSKTLSDHLRRGRSFYSTKLRVTPASLPTLYRSGNVQYRHSGEPSNSAMGNTVRPGKSFEPAAQRDAGEMPMNRNDEQTTPKVQSESDSKPLLAQEIKSLIHRNSAWANPKSALSLLSI